ncbi:tRNA pseudouridine(55) synthase TruB [Leifsonia sp. Root112D2]|uniref:tRNA pseudouridine(55) synthase TruB n=1 Tax=Leifsonia sp. Root112D2 TaxID=1736426 RepID=UPI0006F59F0C|nr:tRNA pseudouridine(55) synthase TruB [Leifsonia sp. Root112D2]KQV05190.1 tRNA pseudouridine synthase B [Leifsonia sp. Root112D2]
MNQTPSASGILLVDKAQGWTSHDAVARTRRLAGTRKVGHAGTLDPMATGLLVLGIGSSTRLLTYVVGADKEYEATIRLGAGTSTDDAEGELLVWAPAASVRALTDDAVRAAIAELTGHIKQVPSAVSAIKVDGKRAYARVRAGEDVVLAARSVTVTSFELLDSDPVNLDDGVCALDLRVRVECSSGTYIRALARDLGAALGVGGHLTALRRTRVGPFRVADAASIEGMDVAARLLAPASAASALFPRYDLTTEQAIDLGHGKRLELPDAQLDQLPGGPVAAIAPDGRLVGLVEFWGSQVRVLANFPADEIVAGSPSNGADEE